MPSLAAKSSSVFNTFSISVIDLHYQSGFRANHSTDTYLSKSTDMILSGAENGKHMGIILIDLQKDFDTLNHIILLHKLKYIGFSDKTRKWFHSYLTNRFFSVALGTVFLEAGIINCGVLQWSILKSWYWSVLLLLYTSNLLQALSNTHAYLHEGDTITFCQHKNVKEIENVLNKKFTNICDGFVDSYEFILVKIKKMHYFQYS